MKFPLALGAAAMAAALSLSACSSGASKGGGASSSVPPIPALAGPVIKIGTIGDYSQSTQFGNAQPERVSAIQAAVDAINVAGGIGGKKVELEPCDEKGDPNQAAACARQFVTDHVVATVGDSSTFADRYNATLLAAGIPRIGPLAVGPTEYTAANNYPLSGGAVTLFGGDIAFGAKLGYTTTTVIAIETPQTSLLTALLAGPLAANKVTNKSTIQIPQDATDMSPYVNKAKQSGAQFVVVGLNPALLEQFLLTSQQLGAKYKVMVPNSALSQASVDKLGGATGAAEGVYLAGPFPPATATGLATIDLFNREMDIRQARGDSNAQLSKRDITVEGWLATHAFGAIAKMVTGTVTAASLDAVLKTAKDVDLGDIMPPWSPSATGSPLPRVTNTEGYLLQVKNGKEVLYQADRVKMF
jgi:ABC-type branched-subunit amino acid transport system substrate-binding protein